MHGHRPVLVRNFKEVTDVRCPGDLRERCWMEWKDAQAVINMPQVFIN